MVMTITFNISRALVEICYQCGVLCQNNTVKETSLRNSARVAIPVSEGGEIMIVHHQMVSSLGNDVSSSSFLFSCSIPIQHPNFLPEMAPRREWCNTHLVQQGKGRARLNN